MRNRLTLLIISWILAIIYCLPYLVYITSSNLYLLRNNYPGMDMILRFYESIEDTVVGRIIYLPLFLVHFTIRDQFTMAIWTFTVLTIAILLIYWSLRLIARSFCRQKNV